MSHTLNSRLSRLESISHLHNPLSHLSDEELEAAVDALRNRQDESIALCVDKAAYNDPELIRIETELAEIHNMNRDEYRAMSINRYTDNLVKAGI